MNTILQEVKDAIRHPYAWPGGYPVYIVMFDGTLLCRDCARKEFRNILDSTRKETRDGWHCIGAGVLWEGVEHCAHCSKQLESAYGEEESE